MENIDYSYQPLGILVQKLRILCNEKQTGRLSILTDTRKFANIVIIGGNIIDISFANTSGKKALVMLSKVQKCRFHFSKEKQKRTTKKPVASLFNNNDVFQQLGENSVLRKGQATGKVLIVDDSALVRNLVRNTLSFKYEVEEASNGLEAIASLSRIKPDLILLDIIMPDLDGYEVLSVIKNNTSYTDVPIFLLTSRDSLMDKVRGKMSKSDKYITKPFSKEELLEHVDNQFKNKPG